MAIYLVQFLWGGSPHKPSSMDLCETCNVRPKYKEPNGYQHPFCGKTCARNKMDQNMQGHSNPINNGPRNTVNEGYIPASRARSRVDSSLRELHSKDAMWQSVVSAFAHDWQDNHHPTIEKILNISLPNDVRKRHEDYRKYLDAKTGAVELKTYYSAQCICDLGVNDVELCNWESCGICNVVKSSFDLFCFHTTHETGRHGRGIYTNLTPARADHFATSSTSSPYRVMLVCNVLVARSKDPREPMQSTSGKTISVNDGERVFVSDSAAVLPRYILLYNNLK
ncbi:hypothetical protein B0H21DRAFT_750060 [Amylocystis lapponica]|nr:hypothetical protein B0H21DRAFT_750060 [Amylocystis lapponica]